MKEVIQLNLTEEESIILQAIAVVGVSVHLKNKIIIEREVHYMEFFMDKWPEACTTLADKMTELVNISAEMIEGKSSEIKMASNRTKKI